MKNSLLITSSPFEMRAALLEDGSVVEVFVERTRSRGVVGNIYRGRVKKILPGMQSAFVDIGLAKDAFLYVSDLRSEAPESGDCESDGAVAIDDEPSAPPPGPPIQERLREGQDLVVQVVKESIAGKGARITSQMTIPGRFLVYMPYVQHLGISRRIEETGERARLKEIVTALREPADGGFIVRTAGEGQGEAEFAADAVELRRKWQALTERLGDDETPALIHCEANLVEKLIRDVVAGDFGEIIVDADRDHRVVLETLEQYYPAMAERVTLHLGPKSLFESYGVESEIERGLRSKVWLKSGGYIVINQTEALVAIDVNTGRYVGKSSLEQTALDTNVQAVRELVRQIRLRDLGGLIVVDFIDMEEAENRARLVAALEVELRRDRARTKALQLSDFGLVEMTRKRTKPSLERLLSRTCQACSGTGRVKSTETISHEIYRELYGQRHRLPGDGVLELRVHPDVERELLGPSREMLDELAKALSRDIEVQGDDRLKADKYDYLPVDDDAK